MTPPPEPRTAAGLSLLNYPLIAHMDRDALSLHIQAIEAEAAQLDEHGPYGNEGYCRCGYFIGHYGNSSERWAEHIATPASVPLDPHAESDKALDRMIEQYGIDPADWPDSGHNHADGELCAASCPQWAKEARQARDD